MLADVRVSLTTVVIVVGPVTKAPLDGLMKFTDSVVLLTEAFVAVTITAKDDVELPAVSYATAVNATGAFGTVVEFHANR